MKTSVWRSIFHQKKTPTESADVQSSRWRQYLVILLVNISTFVAGSVYGWSAPLLPVLQSQESPVGIPPISDTDASWLASIFCLSRIIAMPIYMYSIDRLGCKITGYLVAAPFILGYSLLLFANSMSMLFWGRFMVGIAAGGTGILGPTYTSDVAEDSNKGKLGVIFAQTMIVGITYTYAAGYYASYAVFHASLVIITVIFVFALIWLPESPLFLMTAGKTEQAKEVLRWLRNDKESEYELERMKVRAEEVLKKRSQKVSISDMTDRRLLRGFFISMGLILNQQMTGIGPIESYTVMIFEQAGSAIPPNITTILLGVLMIIGSNLSYLAVERSGRRFLLIASDIGLTLCLTAVGTYFYLQSLGWNMDAFGWLPIVSLCLYILISDLGIGVIPFSIPMELIHPNYRSFVQTASVIMLSLACFVPVLTYVPLMNLTGGPHSCFWLYAACCAIGTVCIFLTVPETKNRSLEDVLQQLNSDHYIHSVVFYKEKTKNTVKHVSNEKPSLTMETENV